MTDDESSALAVDLEGLRQELAVAGAEEILGDLVETFADDAPRRMDAIDSALQSGDCEQVRTAAHAYKSAAGTMRARELATLLLDLERAGSEGDLDRATALQPAVHEAHERALACMSETPGSGERGA